MKVTVTGRHLKLGDDIQSYAEGKIRKAETFFDRIIEAHMVLSAEKHRRIAEITLSAKRATFHAREETENIYASIDKVMEKVDTQIRRYKEKLRDRKHQGREMTSGIAENIAEETDEDVEAQIIKVKSFAPKPMTPREALMMLDESEDNLLMFSNSQTNEVNVIYKRKDGNYGWIEPDFE